MSRLGPIDPETMTPEQQKQVDTLLSWRKPLADGTFGGPFDAWLRSPELSNRAQGFGGFLWERTVLDRGVVEYVIAVTAGHWRCNIEFVYHRNEAAKYGVDAADLDTLISGDAPPSGRQDLRLAATVARALLENQSLSDELYAAGVSQFGERGMVEIAAIAGYYTLVSFSLRVFDLEAEGLERPFERPPEAGL